MGAGRTCLPNMHRQQLALTAKLPSAANSWRLLALQPKHTKQASNKEDTTAHRKQAFQQGRRDRSGCSSKLEPL